jgi:RNA polymerase sigma-70 factor (ECF subfamily)
VTGRELGESMAENDSRREAIEQLVESHGARLYALGLRFCGDREEARDLVQETFLHAFRSWDQFEGRSSPASWLYTIASRVCQRLHRRRAGEPGRVESLDTVLPFAEPTMAVAPDREDDDAAYQEVRRESRREVEAAIGSLPLIFRMPLVLKEIVGFSVAEVARILDLKEATVKTRLHRARLKVRDALERRLARRALPPTPYSKQMCLDLLRAKQDCLDRGEEFVFPGEVICERCRAYFATLDLAQDICRDIARGELPADLREVLVRELREAAASDR